jgi:hypothetical protein
MSELGITREQLDAMPDQPAWRGPSGRCPSVQGPRRTRKPGRPDNAM